MSCASIERVIALANAPTSAGRRHHAMLITRSAAFRGALKQLERLAPYDDVTILLEGESGTGKTWLAEHIHGLSRRASRRFVRVDLGAIEEGLAGSVLFGHQSGAYTGARQSRLGLFRSAREGTLFLDEIGKASRSVQQKLLSALEEHEIIPLGSDNAVPIDARIIAATNIPLERLVAEDRLIEDLLHRLNYFRVRIPALRERRADIRDLVCAMVERHAGRYGYIDGPPDIDARLTDMLGRCDWPGNLRQLDAVVRRLLIEANGSAILSMASCRGELASLQQARETGALPDNRAAIERLVRQCGSVTKAARSAGVARSTIYRRLGSLAGDEGSTTSRPSS